ncbi:MAG: nucleotidyltransferase [Thermoplasmatota archaeon]
MHCPYCGYRWTPRTEQPKACPRCKRRLDYPGTAGDMDLLDRAREVEPGFHRTIYVMSMLTPQLEEQGVMPVVIGGAAVEFYTRNWYTTGDIDLAINKDRRDAFYDIMRKAGFEKTGRMWIREDLGLYLEIPGDLEDIDTEKVTRVEVDQSYAYVVGPEDIIFDRVQAAKHWKSPRDREQAVRMASLFYDDIDWDYVRAKCREEESEDMLDEVLEEARP